MQNIGEWIGLIIILAILFNGGSGIFGGGEDTRAVVAEAINNQSTQIGLRDVLLSSERNNYETAMQIAGQNLLNAQQHGTDQVNLVQGFNALSQQLAGISTQLGSCCCEIKTTLLQDKYDSALRELAKAQNEAVNAAQSQYLLSQLGRFVANAPAAA